MTTALGGDMDIESHMPPRQFSRARIARLVLFVSLGIYLCYGTATFQQYEYSLVIVFAIAALGQDWLIGRAGQISLGAAAFMAIGAYTTALVSEQSWGVFPLPVLCSLVAGGSVGLIIGVVGLRFRGLYLALSTLALQFIVAFAAQQYQGDSPGLSVPFPSFFGVTITLGPGQIIMLLVVLGVTIVLLGGAYRRAPGRAWSAIQQNELAANVCGVNTVYWKLLAFVGSSAVIAVAGSMYAYVVGLVTYVPFSLDMAVAILVMVFVGGLRSMSGALIGAAIVQLLPTWLSDLGNHIHGGPGLTNWLSVNVDELAVAIYGLALILVLVLERDGIIGILRRLAASSSRWTARFRPRLRLRALAEK